MAVSTGLEPAIFCVTGRRVNQLHHETKLVAGRGFEPLAFGLWARRATKLLHPAIYNGGGKGIRTPAPLARPSGFQDRSLQPDLGIPPAYLPLIQATNWLYHSKFINVNKKYNFFSFFCFIYLLIQILQFFHLLHCHHQLHKTFEKLLVQWHLLCE